MKDTFLMCKDWEQHMALLTMEQRGQLFTAIFAYQGRGELPQGDPMVRLAFSFMQADFEAENAGKQARAEINRRNGRNGGRPPKPNGLTNNPENPVGFKKDPPAHPPSPPSPSPPIPPVISPPYNPPAHPQKERAARKSAEPKVQWAENVTMTNAEHEKLLAAYGPADTSRLIEILDNHKGATGKAYVSDYRAILSWCTDRLAEERARRGGAKGAGLTYNPPSPAAPGEADRRAQADLERMRQYLADEKRREQEETQ